MATYLSISVSLLDHDYIVDFCCSSIFRIMFPMSYKKEVLDIVHLYSSRRRLVVTARTCLTGCFLVAVSEARIMELSFCTFLHEAAELSMPIQLASLTAKMRMSFKHLIYQICFREAILVGGALFLQNGPKCIISEAKRIII